MHQDDIARIAREHDEAARKNPLLRLTLGQIVNEMIGLAVRYPVMLSDESLPAPVEEYRKRYDALLAELGRREKQYQSYKEPPRI